LLPSRLAIFKRRIKKKHAAAKTPKRSKSNSRSKKKASIQLSGDGDGKEGGDGDGEGEGYHRTAPDRGEKKSGHKERRILRVFTDAEAEAAAAEAARAAVSVGDPAEEAAVAVDKSSARYQTCTETVVRMMSEADGQDGVYVEDLIARLNEEGGNAAKTFGRSEVGSILIDLGKDNRVSYRDGRRLIFQV
jgi:hypothetical protein